MIEFLAKDDEEANEILRTKLPPLLNMEIVSLIGVPEEPEQEIIQTSQLPPNKLN